MTGYTLIADKDKSAGLQDELRSQLAGAVWGSQDEWEVSREATRPGFALHRT